jgi:hypothetical protein
MWHYSVMEKLLVTLNFLSHVPTLRQMSEKWGMPHNSISVYCLHPVVDALHTVFFEQEQNRNIRFPKTPEAQLAVMRGFRTRFSLPGCLGALDESLIQQRKPTSAQANQDTDSYYSYKGNISSLLLAVCDADLRLLYVSAGAPACVGDAGLYSRSRLKANVDDGLMRIFDVPLQFEDDSAHRIRPYLVGDAAFPLSEHMMKVIEPPPAAGSPAAAFNTRALNCRRSIENLFAVLKGRWVFLKRNHFWNSVEFTSKAILVCCALHNYLEDRRLRGCQKRRTRKARVGPKSDGMCGWACRVRVETTRLGMQCGDFW